MNMTQLNSNNPRLLKILGLILLMVLSFVLIAQSPTKVHAVALGQIPLDQQQAMSNYDNPGGSNCFVGGTRYYEWTNAWLFPQGGNPQTDGYNASTAFTVQAGQTLNLNAVYYTFLCHDSINTGSWFSDPGGGNPFEGYPYTFLGTSNPAFTLQRASTIYLTKQQKFLFGSLATIKDSGGTVIGSAGFSGSDNPQVINFQTDGASQTRYWFPGGFNSIYNWTVPSTTFAGTYTYEVDAPVYEANWFQEQGNDGSDPYPQFNGSTYDIYQCTAGGSYIASFTYNNNTMAFPGGCNPLTTRFFITVNVTAPPPTLSCNSVTVNPPSPLSVGQTFSATANYTIGPNNASNFSGSGTLSGPGITGLPSSQGINQPPGTYNMTFPGLTANAAGSYTLTFSAGGGTVNCGNVAANSTTIQVGNEPYFQVKGGNVVSGANAGGVGANCTGTNTAAGILASTNGNNGAGTNLAALAPDVINGFNTSNGTGLDGYNPAAPSGLTFANAPPGTSGSMGDLGTALCGSDYYGTATTKGLTPKVIGIGFGATIHLNTLNSSSPGCTNLGGGSVTYCWYTGPPGQGYVPVDTTGPISGQLVVYIAGDVLVRGNINVQNTGLSLATIPSFYLVADGDIYIDNSTESPNPTIDGVYVAEPFNLNENLNNPGYKASAGGNIYTCTNGYDDYRAANGAGDLTQACSANGTLTVDGALVAQQIKFERTLGNVANPPPAELFTYSPLIWMVNPFNATGSLPANPIYQTVTGLPPVL